MLFSDACGKRFINAVIHCVRFKGTENVHIIDSKIFEGPLLSQYNNATAWIKQYLAVEYVMHGFDPRQEIWELPLDAIKEALTNAICHRDYFDNGAKIMVQLYDDRLELSNLGGLLPYVAADFGHRSRSRNPLIFQMFTRMHLVESVGTGIPRIGQLLSADGFPPAEYKTEGFLPQPSGRRNKFLSNNQEKVRRKVRRKRRRKFCVLLLPTLVLLLLNSLKNAA